MAVVEACKFALVDLVRGPRPTTVRVLLVFLSSASSPSSDINGVSLPDCIENAGVARPFMALLLIEVPECQDATEAGRSSGGVSLASSANTPPLSSHQK